VSPGRNESINNDAAEKSRLNWLVSRGHFMMEVVEGTGSACLISAAKFLGMVRVRQEGDEWRWVPVEEWAPEHAVIAKRYKVEGEEVISIEEVGSGQFIHGAVRAKKH
jgi:hypothetical protein